MQEAKAFSEGSRTDVFASVGSAPGGVDVVAYVEWDPDHFFHSLWTCCRSKIQGLDADRVLMLQCVLAGRDREAYSATSAEEDLDYDSVKLAVLKA